MAIINIPFGRQGRPLPLRLKPKTPIDIGYMFRAARDAGEKIYIVLPGGGAKGRWQFAVLYYLWQAGALDYCAGACGTSVGGLNALIWGRYYKEPERALKLWEEITCNEDVYKGKLGGAFEIAWQTMISNKGVSILRPDGLYKILEDNFSGYYLKDFIPDIVLTASDISKNESDVYTREDCDIPCDNLGKRTSALPLIFPAIEGRNRGHLHVDGGFGNNNPVMTAINRGATKIIIIGSAPIVKVDAEINNKAFDIAPHLINYALDKFEQSMWAEVYQYEQRAKTDKSIPTVVFMKLYPDKDTGDVVNFGNREQLQLGYDYAYNTITPARVLDFLEC